MRGGYLCSERAQSVGSGKVGQGNACFQSHILGIPLKGKGGTLIQLLNYYLKNI